MRTHRLLLLITIIAIVIEVRVVIKQEIYVSEIPMGGFRKGWLWRRAFRTVFMWPFAPCRGAGQTGCKNKCDFSSSHVYRAHFTFRTGVQRFHNCYWCFVLFADDLLTNTRYAGTQFRSSRPTARFRWNTFGSCAIKSSLISQTATSDRHTFSTDSFNGLTTSPIALLTLLSPLSYFVILSRLLHL